MAGSRPADVYLLSAPRTLSNLLVKLFSEQTGWETSSYLLHDAFLYAQSHLNERDAEFPAEEFGTYLEMLRAGYQTMLATRESAHEKGHACFLKSHIMEVTNPSPFFASLRSETCPSTVAGELETSLSSSPRTNPTLLSDGTLLSFVPVFLIRHPALVAESYYRAKGFPSAADLRQSNAPFSTNLRFTRALFEWYEAAAAPPATANTDSSQRRRRPILVDADDLLEGDTVQRLATALGMDPAQILQQWEPQSTEGLAPDKKPFVQDMWESTCIDKSKSAKGLDLEAKLKSWNELHGEEMGKVLADLTVSRMEDYMWLKSRKL